MPLAYVDHDDRSAAGRTGTGLSLRQNALDPGFMGFRLVRRGAPPDQLAKRYATTDSMNAAFTPYGLVRVVPE
jgi:hypothetical protein